MIVDNASSDKSLIEIKGIRLPLKIITNNHNIGFAGACNQGAKGSSADYLLFLNPDTRLFENSIEKAVSYMEEYANKGIGILGIQLIDSTGRISKSCARFPSLKGFLLKTFGVEYFLPSLFKSHFMTEWDHDSTQIVDQVMGAFFLTRRNLFVTISGFDERFFVYFEEVDYSVRSLKAGYKSVYLATAQAFHKGGGTSEQVKAKRLFYSTRSRILYGFKHFNKASAILLALCSFLVEPFSRLFLALIHLSPEEAIEVLKAYRLLFCDVSNIYKKISE